jgi:hypothetical protein
MKSMEARTTSVLGIVALLVVVGLAVLAVRLVTAPPKTETLTGGITIALTPMDVFARDVRAAMESSSVQDVAAERDACRLEVGGATIEPGRQIVLYDEAGVVIGRGTLGPGHDRSAAEAAGSRCRLPFVIEGIRTSRLVAIGLGVPGERIAYTAADLDAQDWSVELTVAP